MNTRSYGAYEKATNRIRPFSEDVETTVEVRPEDSLFNWFVEMTIQTILTFLDPAMQVDEREMTSVLRHYLSVLLKDRVDYVNSQRVPVKPKDNAFCVPDFFSICLEQVGKVDDQKLGRRFTPVYSGSDPWESALSEVPIARAIKGQEKEQWLREQRGKLIRWFNASGLGYATCMPVNKEGSADLMSMNVVDGGVKGPNSDVHPLFGTIAAVLGIHQVDGPFASASMNYGTFEMLRESIAQCATLQARDSVAKDR